MQDNPGFRLLKEAFQQFADKYAGQDLTGRIVRSVATGGKALVDQGMVEFPKTFVGQAAKDMYDLLASQEVADGFSALVRDFDEEKVKSAIDGFAASLKDGDQALKLAKQLKDLLNKAPIDDIGMQIEGLIGGVPMQYQLIFSVMFSQIKPILEEIKTMSDEDAAEKLKELADSIPSEMIAAQVAALTREVTPERVSKQAHDTIGQLPSPSAIADVVHGIASTASQHLGRASKSTSLSEVGDIAAEFAQNALDVVQKTIAADTASKKTFNKKKGQDFDL